MLARSIKAPGGREEDPNQADANAATTGSSEARPVSSKNTADLPAGSDETPSSGTAEAKDAELSSIVQPSRETADEPMFVTSNQSAP